MQFDVILGNPMFFKQPNGLFTVIIGDHFTGKVTKQEDLTEEQMLELVQAFFESLSE